MNAKPLMRWSSRGLLVAIILYQQSQLKDARENTRFLHQQIQDNNANAQWLWKQVKATDATAQNAGYAVGSKVVRPDWDDPDRK